ncbi:MAG: hypothetical protein KY437_11385, partial [Actinobacteria bacterium]|nr:hypothetical protein [Actinomycetota bacterium]
GLCGHGHFDLGAYDAYLSGALEDPDFDQASIDAALARLPDDVPALRCARSLVTDREAVAEAPRCVGGGRIRTCEG